MTPEESNRTERAFEIIEELLLKLEALPGDPGRHASAALVWLEELRYAGHVFALRIVIQHAAELRLDHGTRAVLAARAAEIEQAQEGGA